MIQQLIAFILAELAAGRSFLETDGDGVTRAYVPIAALRSAFPITTTLDSAIALNVAVIANASLVKTVDDTKSLIIWEDEFSTGVMVTLGATVIPAVVVPDPDEG